MEMLVGIQRWLYGGMAEGLGAVAEGNTEAIFAAMAAAVLFGALHALMPGHGKTVLVSYHLGQPSKLWEGFGNGAILALTHVGLAVILVVAGFAVISRVFAFGGRTPQFEIASGVLIMLIGAFLLWRSIRRGDHEHSRDGRTLAFVTGMIPCPLTTFVMSYALARGMIEAGLIVTAAMALGMIATIGGIALAATFARERLMSLLASTEAWRGHAGFVLEIGSSILVFAFGAWTLIATISR
jgi:ABC-type nickel/cobalt efflux system permease component RcnA